jgi:hypothetical protein
MLMDALPAAQKLIRAKEDKWLKINMLLHIQKEVGKLKEQAIQEQQRERRLKKKQLTLLVRLQEIKNPNCLYIVGMDNFEIEIHTGMTPAHQKGKTHMGASLLAPFSLTKSRCN